MGKSGVTQNSRMMRSTDTDRWEWLSPGRFAVLLAVLTLAAHADVALGLRTFAARDFGVYTYPLAQYHRESLWHGEWPLWNPFTLCGAPHLAQWNTLILYPPSLLYVLLPMPWSLNMFCLLHQFVAGLGMFLLAHRWTGHRLAAAVAGIGFTFAGLTVSSLTWSAIMAGLGWMPWVVWLVERAWRQGGRAMIWAAGAGAMQMLSGAPEVILMTWMALGTLLLVESWTERTGLARRLGRLALVVILITGLAAVQLVPFVDALQSSHRAGGAEPDRWWISAWGLGNLLVPGFHVTPLTCGLVFQGDQSWVPTYYPGLGILALGCWGALAARTWLARWLAVLTGLGLWLALGDQAGLLKVLKSVLPLLGLIRFPVKYLFLAGFALPLLAALAVRDWTDGTETTRARLRRFGPWLLAVIAALMSGVLVLAWLRPLETGDAARTLPSALSRLLFLAGVAGVMIALGRPATLPRQGRVGVVLLGLLWLDALTHAPRPNPTAPCSVFASPGPAAAQMNPPPTLGQGRAMLSFDALDALSRKTVADVGTTCLIKRLGLYGACNLMDRIPTAHGFFPLIPGERQDLDPVLLDANGVPRRAWADFLGVTNVMLSGDTLQWVRRPTARPLITGGQSPVFLARSDALTFLGSDKFDPERLVVLPLEAGPLVRATNSSQVSISEANWNPHRLTFVSQGTGPGLVVIAQNHSKHWQAKVDGVPMRIWRANHGFQALDLPAGRHQVSVEYQDGGFRLGAWITVLTALGCGAGWLRTRVPAEPRASGVVPASAEG